MFTHLLWDTDLGRVSTYFDIFEPILYYIDKYSPVEKIKRMKLNLYTNQNKKILHPLHKDVHLKKTKDYVIGVYHFNTCNGETIVNDEKLTFWFQKILVSEIYFLK